MYRGTGNAGEPAPLTIVCLGDSVTAAPRETGWVQLLAEKSRHRWINAGVVGDTAPGMLSRLDAQVLPARPDMAVLLGGFNDVLLEGSTACLRSCVSAMVHHCVRQQVVPVVGIPYGISRIPEQWRPLCPGGDVSGEWNRYLDWLESFCRVFHLRKVDLRPVFPPDGSFLADGLHPNAAGHRAIARAMAASGYFRE